MTKMSQKKTEEVQIILIIQRNIGIIFKSKPFEKVSRSKDPFRHLKKF